MTKTNFRKIAKEVIEVEIQSLKKLKKISTAPLIKSLIQLIIAKMEK